MAKKHFDAYYENIRMSYLQMSGQLNKLVESLEKGEANEEDVERFKQAMLPIANSFQTVSWIKMLLDQPTRKQKKETFERQMKKLKSQLDKEFSTEQAIQNNAEALQRLKDITE